MRFFHNYYNKVKKNKKKHCIKQNGVRFEKKCVTEYDEYYSQIHRISADSVKTGRYQFYGLFSN